MRARVRPTLTWVSSNTDEPGQLRAKLPVAAERRRIYWYADFSIPLTAPDPGQSLAFGNIQAPPERPQRIPFPVERYSELWNLGRVRRGDIEAQYCQCEVTLWIIPVVQSVSELRRSMLTISRNEVGMLPNDRINLL